MINTSIIDRYVSMRIDENEHWYGAKNMLTNTARLNKQEVSLFHALSFAGMLSLSEGHTVTMVPKDKKNVWECLLSPIQTYLESSFADHADLVDFKEVLASIEEYADDAAGLSELIDCHVRDFLNVLNHTGNTAHQRRLYEVFLIMLRAYYLIQVVLKDDVDRLVNALQASRFFAHHDQIAIGTPIIYKNTDEVLCLWSNRAYHAEKMTIGHIERICGGEVGYFDATNLPQELNEAQKQAIQMVSRQPFAIITGGPGTGKTFTVAQIVVALVTQNPDIELALAAPTGKAAQRMSESLTNSLKNSAVNINLPEPKTIHRLLGIGENALPRYHEGNPLSHDVIIVDEASMLGMELSCHLLSAVKTGARLILLGDAHQLAAVEAGAVLSDLCRVPSLYSHRVHLVESRRFDAHSAVGKLATLINEACDDGNKSLQVLALVHEHEALTFNDIAKNVDYYHQLCEGYERYFQATKKLLFGFDELSDDARQFKIKELMEVLNQYRILTASHVGTAGDASINNFIAKRHKRYLKNTMATSAWYHGRVVMVQVNRYDLGLFNGDVGVCVQQQGELAVYFDGNVLKKVSVAMLGGDTVATAYAITVHKSQGSEFERVSVVFDDMHARLLCKELIYTAVTRAKKQVSIHATLHALQLAVTTPTIRSTGLGVL
ncbi:exodeoxyribonuclease V subunit alpha [Moraxella sp. Tifton1]|uniref:exodeoxyribonuclease V subunit alpha n=1 Tax=Moraxella oculi TaxID=2940516 RepID=UPI002013AA1E|nr:exodeoxyribonuclease V subunit alpha [Moraxella sp. Tifton1]MCL1623368.1 exodeoxyribonuclease V subunit alpha [Moraxella sp. Tifton1]